MSSSQGYNPGFSTSPSRHSSPNLKGAGLRRSSTLPTSGYSQDALMSASGAPDVSWDFISWTPPGITTSNDSPPTPPLLHSPSSTDSSSGDRTIPMSSFIDIALPANPSLPCNTSDKAPPLSFDRQGPPYTYAAQSHAIRTNSKISELIKKEKMDRLVIYLLFRPPILFHHHHFLPAITRLPHANAKRMEKISLNTMVFRTRGMGFRT